MWAIETVSAHVAHRLIELLIKVGLESRIFLLFLTADGIWGLSTPLLKDFFVKNIGSHVTEILLAKFLKKFQGSSCPRELSSDLSSAVDIRNFAIFEDFRAYLREFLIFVHEIFTIARSYQVLAADIKSLLESAQVSLEKRLRSRFWPFFADFGIFQAVRFGTSLWYTKIIFYENLVQSVYFYV